LALAFRVRGVLAALAQHANDDWIDECHPRRSTKRTRR
jgi:hypothetical protein